MLFLSPYCSPGCRVETDVRTKSGLVWDLGLESNYPSSLLTSQSPHQPGPGGADPQVDGPWPGKLLFFTPCLFSHCVPSPRP